MGLALEGLTMIKAYYFPKYLFFQSYTIIFSPGAYLMSVKSLVIKQKSQSQNGNSKKTKHAIFSKRRTLLTP